MHIEQLNGKNILLLGFGVEGQSTLNALSTYAGEATVTVCEHYPSDEAPDLEEFDFVIKSPGIPPNQELEDLGEKLTSATQIFLDTIAEIGSTVIGITGSKGKSTTASLIYQILIAGGKDALLIGNIGKPALDYIEHATSNTLFVMEMSSYQLMSIERSPHIAVITSFFPEHLNYHGSLEMYKEAKTHITRFQGADDIVFYNALSKDSEDIANESSGTKVPFSPEDSPVTLEETHLLGMHNLGNIAAAYKVATHLGISKETCREVFKEFKGLPHRLQRLGTKDSVEWVDDAISTTPESTIAALDALGDTVSVVLLGGQDRGNDFTELGKRIAASSVSTVILFPESGARIQKALRENNATAAIQKAASMEEAVTLAKKNAKPNTICLLSPASPSYGMFKNFEEKGEMFKKAIGL